MATLTFSYRSNKNKAFLEARLSFRVPGANLNPKTGKEMPYSFYTRSRIETTKEFWKEYKRGVKFKDGDKINLRKDIHDKTYDLKEFVLEKFRISDKCKIDKKWLIDTVHQFYNPPEEEELKDIPKQLNHYFDYYLELRDHEMTSRLKAKYNVVKHKLDRFNSRLLVKDVNERFKKEFVEWCQKEQYSSSTIDRDLKHIKTILKHANLKGLEVSKDFDKLKFQTDKTPIVYLSFEELKAIQKVKGLPDHLDNARDWLIISCFVGQRISDFMRFNKSMIRIEKDVPLIEFTQTKTGVDMAIPILPEVSKILEKRNGEFPRSISDQRYNDYIKKVCKKAKIKTKIKGKKAKNISEDKNETEIRKVVDVYPKWKLITSHIGRRSFATNFYGKMPTTFLMSITGHKTERMFLNYIGKGQKDFVFDAFEHFKNLDRN